MIEKQVAALQALNTPYLVLSGEEYKGKLNHRTISALNYCQSAAPESYQELLDHCLSAAQEAFGQQAVIWLIHNPTLGKNIMFPSLVRGLAEAQQYLVLHCHDFAEDGRGDNYQLLGEEETYPIAPNIHYAFINSKDYQAFRKTDIPSTSLHLLPNAIQAPKLDNLRKFAEKKRVIYPVRGIRRKNVGELLLWAALAPEDTEFALTLAPENQLWLPYYQIWDSLAYELKLPVHLNCVDKVDATGQTGKSYEDWMRAATHCITTSVAEGFGLTFLEPLSVNIPIIGRDIPEITADFRPHCQQLGNLYQKLLIPVYCVDTTSLYSELNDALESSYLVYNREYKEEFLQEAWREMTKFGYIDFSNLPEHQQVQVITKVRLEGFRDIKVLSDGIVLEATEWLRIALNEESDQDYSSLLSAFSQENYTEKLHKLLHSVASSKRGTVSWQNRDEVLDLFLSPSHFHFLKS